MQRTEGEAFGKCADFVKIGMTKGGALPALPHRQEALPEASERRWCERLSAEGSDALCEQGGAGGRLKAVQQSRPVVIEEEGEAQVDVAGVQGVQYQLVPQPLRQRQRIVLLKGVDGGAGVMAMLGQGLK